MVSSRVLHYVVHLKDCVDVLKSQVRHVKFEDIIIDSPTPSRIIHPMHGRNGNL